MYWHVLTPWHWTLSQQQSFLKMSRTQTSAAKTGRFLCDEKSDLFTYLPIFSHIFKWFRYVPLVSQSCRESRDIRHESTCSTKTLKWPPISTRSNALHLSKAKNWKKQHDLTKRNSFKLRTWKKWNCEPQTGEKTRSSSGCLFLEPYKSACHSLVQGPCQWDDWSM